MVLGRYLIAECWDPCGKDLSPDPKDLRAHKMRHKEFSCKALVSSSRSPESPDRVLPLWN